MTTAGSLPITAAIIAHNSAPHLQQTLTSVDFCQERLVLDSGSTDGSIDLALQAGARVEHQPFLGYGPQKQAAVALASHDWILSLDTDECLDEEARAAILKMDLSDPRACYALRRRTFIGTREMRHGPWARERLLRLFNRTTANFSPLEVHEQVLAQQRPTLLPGSILHASFSDSSAVIRRSLRYAPLKARILRRQQETAAAWTLPLRGGAMFLKSYLLQGGWRDGAGGFVVAVGRALDSTLPRAMVLLDEDRRGNPGEIISP